MENISIGLLLPTSTIFPMSKDFERGIKQAIKENNLTGIDFEFVKEFIGQGDLKRTQDACNKLFNYDNVDLITGIVSAKTVSGLASLFQSKKTPFIVSDLGGHIPEVDSLNEYIFFNGAHLWRHAWTIGHYGVNKIGKKGMYVGAVYDAGYSFCHMLHEGMQAADPSSEWSFAVPPMPNPGELSNMELIFPYLEEYQPDFIFSTFCGTEATLFLDMFIEKGWHKKTKLFGLPYLLSPFEKLTEDITIYTTSLNNTTPEHYFFQQGYETGNIIASITSTATSAKELQALLLEHNNLFSLNNSIPISNSIEIKENNIPANASSFSSGKVDEWHTLDLDTDTLRPLTQGISATWYNPYLCI